MVKGLWLINLKERDCIKTKEQRGYNTEVNLQEIGWNGVDQIHLAQNKENWSPVMNTLMNSRVPLNVRNLATG